MQNRTLKSVVVVLAAGAVVVGGAAAAKNFGAVDAVRDMLTGTAAVAEEQYAPPTAQVERGTVTRLVTGGGEVKASATEKLKTKQGRWFKSFDAPLNKRVAAGDPLLTYTNGEVMPAPYDLVVTAYTMPKERQELSQDEHFVEVQRIDTVSVSMQVAEIDLPLLSAGQSVQVKLAADESTPREGTIGSVNEVGAYSPSGSKFTVSVIVPNDGSIKLGMSANLSVAVAQAADVLTVPVSALNGSGDQKFVQVTDAQGAESRMVPVVSGLTDGKMVEVSGEGLKEGDTVLLNEVPVLGDGYADEAALLDQAPADAAL